MLVCSKYIFIESEIKMFNFELHIKKPQKGSKKVQSYSVIKVHILNHVYCLFLKIKMFFFLTLVDKKFMVLHLSLSVCSFGNITYLQCT